MTMPEISMRYPQTRNTVIDRFFDGVASESREIINRGPSSIAGRGLFNEDRQIAVYALLRHANIDTAALQYAHEVELDLSRLFLDTTDLIPQERVVECMTLCLYGLILGDYNDEDFRYLYRASLSRDYTGQLIEEWLRSALVVLSAIESDLPEKMLLRVREWMDYLGTPQWAPREFVDAFRLVGIELEPILEQEGFRLVDTLRRRPSYIKEATESRRYQDFRALTEHWLPDVLSSEVLREYRREMYSRAQTVLTEEDTIESSIRKVREFFERVGFRPDTESTFPVRLQELPRPPPADAVNPMIFEMVPPKMRVSLLPSVAYSIRTRRVELLFLGGPEIGRSCILLKTETSAVLLDFGLSVANQSVPHWVPELEMIDSVLISHAHLDHVGGLPVLYANYAGKWCSTPLTGAITISLLEDALTTGTPAPPRRDDEWDRISRLNRENLERVIKNHISLEPGKSAEVAGGVVVTPVDADHIPGSTAFILDVEGFRILYTGDFNLDSSVLFRGAQLPNDCDVTIFDGTYWGREDFDRQRATQILADVSKRNGPVIIPSFAVGRTQEILKILDSLDITEQKNVMVAGLAESVTKTCGLRGRWSSMKKNKTELDREDILVAGGGMMAGGLAREFFNIYRDSPDAAVVLCGYLARRTPGWNLLHGHEHHRCRVEYARLSAHSSSSRLQQWVAACTGKTVMVHTPIREPPSGVILPHFRQRLSFDI